MQKNTSRSKKILNKVILEGSTRRIDAFVTGSDRHLCVNYWNGSAWVWADQGLPPGTTVSSAPGVISFSYSAGGQVFIAAFVTGADGHLCVNYWNGSAWQWADQGVPPGTTASGVPEAVSYVEAGQLVVAAFVTGADGHLCVNYWNGSAWQWADQGVPPGTTATGALGVITYPEGGQQLVDAFVMGASGHLGVNYWNGSAWHWADQGLVP